MPGGRPSKLTPQTKELLKAAGQRGATIKDACLGAGIGTSTFYRWEARAKEEKSGEYREFWDEYEQSKAECVLINLNTVMTAVKEEKDWRAAAWLLPKLRPDVYGDKQQIKTEHSGEVRIIINAEHKP